MAKAVVISMILWATHLKSLASAHFELTPGFYQIGRSTENDPEDKLGVPFDRKLSRRTARIEVKATRLKIKRDGSKAPLFVEGLEKDEFELLPGQRFGVAETVFELAQELGQTMTVEEVDHSRASQSDQVLSLMLELQPLFQGKYSLEELGRQINKVLAPSKISVFKADPLTDLGETELVPSKSLVAQACQAGEPVYFEWTGSGGAQPTAAQGETWALAAPIFSSQEKLLLYAVGQRNLHNLERGGLCILAQMLRSHLEARLLGDLTAAKAALDQLKSDVDPKVRKATERALRGEKETAPFKVFSLGGFEAHFQGERVDKQWSGKQSAWLLAYLASTGKPVTEDRLLEDFWPDKGPKAKKTLAVAISRLRKGLQEAFSGDPILRSATGYGLNREFKLWLDYTEIEDLLSLLQSEKMPELASEQILKAGRRLLALHRGAYMEGCYLDWAVRRRSELESKLQETFLRVGEYAFEKDESHEALAFAERCLKLDPCSQRAYLITLQGLTSLGKPEQAIRQYEECRKTLERELDIEPSMDLFKAYQMAKLAL